MLRYEHMLRFQVYRLLKRRYYQHYGQSISKITNTDPFVLSREYLSRLLSFVRDNNTYYAKFLLEDRVLNSLPVLTKAIIRQYFEYLRSTKHTAATYKNSSGGSTGKPVTLIQDTNYTGWSEATQGYYFKEFLGVERNAVKSVWLWGSERDLLKIDSWRTKVVLFLQNQLFLNTFQTSEQRWLEYIERIRSYRPYYVAGYAGSLYQMARAARKYNVRLYQPKFVYSSAEMLRDFMRKEIEEAFNTKVYDYYGSREVGAIAGECSMGRRHVFVMNNLVEILDDTNRQVGDGEEGKIIITNLHNYSMPMIRYDIGDLGVMSADRCGCGSSLPVLERLTGRVTDHFLLRNGTRVHGEFFTHLFYFRDWVEQFQIDQLDYDYLKISVVPNLTIDERDRAVISENIRTVMGKECKLEWLCVDQIKTTPQGKYLFTRCLIDQ